VIERRGGKELLMLVLLQDLAVDICRDWG
jgi:hypothetical protein